MNRTIALIVLLLVGGTAAAQSSSSESTVLDFEALDLEGQVFRGESLLGKTVLIDFWAVWCAPCVKAFPELSRLQHELGGDRFQVLGMAAYSGGPDKVKKFLDGRGVRYPVVVANSDLVERFEVIGYPTYFLIDERGRIVRKLVGEVDDLYGEILALVGQRPGRSKSSAKEE